MVDHRTRFGILLLLHTKDRSWKKSGSPDIASFSLLIEELNQVAERLVEARPNIEKSKVLGIDLT